MTATIDMDVFEKAFAEALPVEVKFQTERAKRKAGTAMAVPLFEMPDIGAKFCSQWPRILGFLSMGITTLGWFMPAQAAAAKAFLTAFDKTFMPIICPVPK